MTCEDCLYKGFCENQYGDTDYFDDETICGDVEKQCGKFEGKHQYVKLRFKKGDKIYWIEAPKIKEAVVRQYGGEQDSLWYVADVGKKVVVINDNRAHKTKEEAEKALQKGSEG